LRVKFRRRPRHVPLVAATVLALLLLLAIPAVGAAADGGDAGGEPAIRDTILPSTTTRALVAASATWGGVYTTSTGDRVRVFSSDSYPQDDRNQRWAEFLSQLLHGGELSTVTLVLSPYNEVQRVCGRSAVACYGNNTIYASADQVEPGISAESVVAHEYGHHVAASRSNTPWEAVDWGTKRWASYENICAGAQAGQLFPGDERGAYQLNPGEAFAEAYRVLNERRLGMTESPWTIVDQRFYPDATALTDVEQDVVSPWTRPTTLSFSGRVVKRAVRTLAVATTLDGRMTAIVRTSAARVRAELLVGGRVVSSGTGRAVTLSTTVCGSRSATVRIRNAAKATRYTVSVARP
jgi:hypothetical protein